MRKIAIIFQMACFAALALCCTNCSQSGSEVARIVEERDSLRNLADASQQRLQLLDTLIITMNRSMDSIASGEEHLFVNGVSEGGDTRSTIMRNIDRLANIISNQKKVIEELEKKISDRDDIADSHIVGLIANYKKQLADKDNQIAQLKGELSKKNADISRLNSRIGVQSKAIAELDKRATMQTEALQRQDAMLNNCYFTVGTKKELEKKGVIKRGKVLSQATLDPSKFSKVDIRRFTEIELNTKRLKVLTPMPETSYTIETIEKGRFRLKINNPSDFWKMSNYLVIQTN